MRDIFALLFAGSVVAASGADTERQCEWYRPQVKHVTIHEGKLAAGHYAYNHMASVEWFDGRFHAVWGGHAETHLEGKPGQVNVWATSADFERWSAPQKLAHTGPDALPLDPQCVQWQPNLLNSLANPAPRLYLGDGFEVDYLPGNSEAEFLVDLDSLRSRITAPVSR
jgi:hypothetical protein